MSNNYKVPFLTRLKFAWKAFWLKECHITLPFDDFGGQFKSTVDCDNARCQLCTSHKKATEALYQTTLKIHIGTDNSYFLCEDCYPKAIGLTEKPY